MEVEIKLHVLPGVPGGAERLFERLAAESSLGGYPLGRPTRIPMRDLYYDTAGSNLARAGAGLRLRKEGRSTLVTLKLKRAQQGALAVREEYEMELDATGLAGTLDRIRPLIGSQPVPFADFAAGRPAGPLIPVLEIRTERIARAVGDVAVLTLDRVEYPGLALHPYHDIEVETLHGQAGEAALRRLEQALLQLVPGSLVPATQNKLERGLRLKEAPGND